jgi:hypothetical protein
VSSVTATRIFRVSNNNLPHQVTIRGMWSWFFFWGGAGRDIWTHQDQVIIYYFIWILIRTSAFTGFLISYPWRLEREHCHHDRN